MAGKMTFNQKAILILCALIFFHLLVNFYILNKSRIVRVSDEGEYIVMGFGVSRHLINKDYKGLFDLFSKGAFSYGPFSARCLFPLIEGMLLTLPAKVGLKDINPIIIFSNAVFLFILLFSTYKIGSILFDTKTGLAAAVLLFFSPIVFSYSRLALCDLALAAMVCLAMLCLLKTDYFQSAFFSILAAAAFLLAHLTKETAIIFIAPAFLYYARRALFIKEHRKKRIANLSFTVLLCILPIGWSIKNQDVATYFLQKTVVGQIKADIFYYFSIFPAYYMGIFLAVALAPLILHYVVNIRKRDAFLTIWLIIPLIISSFVAHRIPRFLISLLPSFFLIMTFEIFASLSAIRKIYIRVLIVCALLQYFLFSFFPALKLPRPDFIDWSLLSARQDKEYPTVERILKIFHNENSGAAERKQVLPIFNKLWFDGVSFGFERMASPFFVTLPQRVSDPSAAMPGKTDWREYLLSADYVLDKTGDPGETGDYENIGGIFKDTLQHNRHKFDIIASFETSEGEVITIYRRKDS